LKRATRASKSRAVSAQVFSALTGGQRFPVMIGVIWLAVCSHRISMPLLLSQMIWPTREHGDCAGRARGTNDGRRYNEDHASDLHATLPGQNASIFTVHLYGPAGNADRFSA